MTDTNLTDSEEARLQRLYPEWTVELFERETRPGDADAPRVYTFKGHRHGTTPDFRSGSGPTIAAAAIDFIKDMEQKRRTS